MKQQLFSLLCLTALVAACDETPSDQKYGSLALSTTSATAEKGFTSTDGWAIKLDHFYVSLPSVSVGGLDGVVTASASAQIIDQVAPGPKTLVEATVRAARAWDDVHFEIGPAALTDGAPPSYAAPAAAGDSAVKVDRMVKEGLSLLVEGSATRGAVTKKFSWGFTTDTSHTACAGEVNGALVPGLVVPPEGGDGAEIGMRADVLFSNTLGNPGAATSFDAFASADGDNDGTITLDELRAVTLEKLRTGAIGPYDVAKDSTIADLGGYAEELTRHVVSTFRAKGSCKAEPVAAAAAP